MKRSGIRGRYVNPDFVLLHPGLLPGGNTLSCLRQIEGNPAMFAVGLPPANVIFSLFLAVNKFWKTT